MNKKHNYTTDTLEVLEGLDPVRRRPGMYTNTACPNHLAQEIIDNAIDEALIGHCDAICVTHHKDGSLSVLDNGRGMPTDMHPELNQTGVELVLTRLHAGGKFSSGNYAISGGLHGVGISVVNALSLRVLVQVWHNKVAHEFEFIQGILVRYNTKKCPAKLQGTKVRFYPDAHYFDSPNFVTSALKHLLHAKAVLLDRLMVTWVDETTSVKQVWQYQNGILDYLSKRLVNPDVDVLPKTPFVIDVSHMPPMHGDMRVVFAWSAADVIQESYVNLIPTKDGGTHVQGLRQGILEALKGFCELHDLLPKNMRLTQEDVAAHLHFVLSLTYHEPKFSGQTKERLSSKEASTLVASKVADAFFLWLNQAVDAGQDIAQMVIEHALKRQKNTRKIERKKWAQGPALPSKLADCRGDLQNGAELFLVEGDSAGGSAKGARDRQFQAILPLRGKILNTWEVDGAHLLASQEIHDIAAAIGVDPRSSDLSGLRYEKICILADADSDGLHIATLICALFVRHFTPLVQAGHVFVAMPPLYRVDIGKEVHYVQDDKELNVLLNKAKKNAQITRFKGLGEMSVAQLKVTTMAPKTRHLVQLELGDEVDATFELMDKLLAKKRAKDRKSWLEEEGGLMLVT